MSSVGVTAWFWGMAVEDARRGVRVLILELRWWLFVWTELIDGDGWLREREVGERVDGGWRGSTAYIVSGGLE